MIHYKKMRGVNNMAMLNVLFTKRKNLMTAAEKILDSADDDGKISITDKTQYLNLTEEIKSINEEIEGEFLNMEEMCMQTYTSPSNKKITGGGGRIIDPFVENANDTKAQSGISGSDYKQKFFNEVKNKFRTAHNTLQENLMDRGGYLVPSEWHDEIISELKSENVLRQICNVIQTENDRKICIVTTSPTADFVQEGQEINLSTEQFAQKTLSAYKLCAGVSVTNELLQDSFYSVEEHLQTEFSKAFGSKEEESLLTGTGTNEPYGLHSIISDNAATMTVQTSGASVEADDIINLVYSLKRPYRKNACFLANDSTIAAIRKIKDADQNYIWAQSLTAGEPNRLLGYPVYSSEYLPSIAAGSVPLLFGDFTKFIIGQRGELSFKPLFELHALRDLTTYLMIERIDGVLTDGKAIRGLKIKS